MIIQCKSCSKKFLVKDEDIPTEGRMVQCSNCSQEWFQAPIIVQMDHPMEDDHYIKSIQILNFNDPVVIKGQCFFTPKSGEAFVSTQIRLAGGESRVWVVSECNKHGKWAVHKDVKVAAGGC